MTQRKFSAQSGLFFDVSFNADPLAVCLREENVAAT